MALTQRRAQNFPYKSHMFICANTTHARKNPVKISRVSLTRQQDSRSLSPVSTQGQSQLRSPPPSSTGTMEYDKWEAETGLEMEGNPLNFAPVEDERLRRVGGRSSAKKRNTATDDDDDNNEHREKKMAEAMTTMIWFDEEKRKSGWRPVDVRLRRGMWIAKLGPIVHIIFSVLSFLFILKFIKKLILKWKISEYRFRICRFS